MTIQHIFAVITHPDLFAILRQSSAEKGVKFACWLA